MAKDYAKFVPPKQRYSQEQPKVAEYFFIFLLVLVICGASGYFLFQKKFVDGDSPLARAMVFLHLKKPAVITVAKIIPKKLVKSNSPDQPQVQFDFYSELPNMQVTLSEPAQGAKGMAQLITTPKPKISETPAVEVTPAAVKPTVVFDSSDVDNLLASETGITSHASNSTAFYIQLGVFESETGAKRLLEAIQSVGFDAHVAKSLFGNRTLYQVTQGPYETRELAKMTQQRMQKRGIISIIRQNA